MTTAAAIFLPLRSSALMTEETGGDRRPPGPVGRPLRSSALMTEETRLNPRRITPDVRAATKLGLDDRGDTARKWTYPKTCGPLRSSALMTEETHNVVAASPPTTWPLRSSALMTEETALTVTGL